MNVYVEDDIKLVTQVIIPFKYATLGSKFKNQPFQSGSVY